MCLAVPGRITAVAGDGSWVRIGKVAFSGVVKEVNLSFVPEADVGDYVLVHAGFAIATLDEAEATRSLAYIDEIESAAAEAES